jgi:hypothetical protein
VANNNYSLSPLLTLCSQFEFILAKMNLSTPSFNLKVPIIDLLSPVVNLRVRQINFNSANLNGELEFTGAYHWRLRHTPVVSASEFKKRVADLEFTGIFKYICCCFHASFWGPFWQVTGSETSLQLVFTFIEPNALFLVLTVSLIRLRVAMRPRQAGTRRSGSTTRAGGRPQVGKDSGATARRTW